MFPRRGEHRFTLVNHCFGTGTKKVHGKVNSRNFSPLCRKITGLCCTGTENNSIELFKKLVCRIIDSDLGTLHKGDPLLLHQINTAINHQFLIELHIRNAVHHKATKAIVTLKNRHAVACLVKLVGAGQARGARSNNRHPLARSVKNLFWFNPPFRKSVFNNRVLNILDGHRRVNNAKDTGAFARSGTDPAGKLRKVVGLGKPVISLMPETIVNIIVPLWHKIVNRATACHTTQHHTGMTVGSTTIHTTSSLILQLPGSHLLMKLLPVFYSFQRFPVGGQCSLELHEPFNFSHINELIFCSLNYLKHVPGREYFLEMRP